MLLVIDFSHWQKDPDPAALKAAGVVAIIHKVSEILANTSPVDSEYKRRKDKYVAAGFLWGAYAYLDGVDGAQQADLFIDTVQPDGTTALVLDVEKYVNLQQTEAAVRRVYDRTGVYPALYSRYEYIVSEIHGTQSPILGQCPLFLADPNVTANPPIPKPWSNWFLWQQGAVNIGGVSVDRDWFNGTLDELIIRWQSISGVLRDIPVPPTPTFDRLDWPVGTAAERALATVGLPGAWFDANPFTNYYEISAGKWNYHDGADLNKNTPIWNADYLEPIYAIGNGVVTFAGPGGGTWGHIIDIKHPLPDGTFIVSRFGHIANPLVKNGDVVARGQQVAQVGDGDGAYHIDGAHLHWNISKPNDAIMLGTPNQWCGTSLQCVTDHYADPVKLVVQYKKGTDPVTNIQPVKWLSPARVDVYEETSILSTVVDTLMANAAGQVDKDTWTTGIDGRGYYKVPGGYVAADTVQFQTVATVKRYVNNPNGATLGANVRSTAAMDSAGNPTGAIVRTLDPATEVQVIFGSVKVGKTIMDQVVSPVQGYVADWLLSVDRPK